MISTIIIPSPKFFQIIMCSIYAICKVTETEVRFKTIVTEYRSSPHSCQAVCKIGYIHIWIYHKSSFKNSSLMYIK